MISGQVHYLQLKEEAEELRIGKFILKSRISKWYPPGKSNSVPLEAHFCRSLSHPNIMKCIDTVDIDRNWFLMVMRDHNGTG